MFCKKENLNIGHLEIWISKNPGSLTSAQPYGGLLRSSCALVARKDKCISSGIVLPTPYPLERGSGALHHPYGSESTASRTLTRDSGSPFVALWHRCLFAFVFVNRLLGVRARFVCKIVFLFAGFVLKST